MADTCDHLIDGRAQPSRSGRTFDTINPATGAVLAEVAFGEQADVDLAVDAAQRAFDEGTWRDLAPYQRAKRLRRTGQLVADHAEQIAELETLDSGKPLSAARGDIAAAVELLDYASTLPENVRGVVHAEEPGYFAHSRREPYGVVGAIAPWNFPFLNAVWKSAGPLAVGNSVVLKMAEQTPLTTFRFAELALEAGIPPGVLNVVNGDGPVTGAALVAHPGVPKITFTGSTAVGREILRAAADEIKSVHLELGGKTPNVVFADADLDQAIAGSLFTSFFNSGQICTSGARLLVADDVADEFLDRYVERADRLTVGDPLSAETQLGPLVSAEQRERVEGYVSSGISEGANVLIGGERPAGDAGGYFYSPTVIADVSADMTIAREEIFGPVTAVMRFADEDELVRIANDAAYGLAATVWTNRLDRALRLTDRLHAGIVWVNSPHHLRWNAPYEGHKHSGLGEDLGLEMINTYTKLKVSYMNYGGHRLEWG